MAQQTAGGDASIGGQLKFPGWVPQLTEPTQEVAGGTYISLHDYNLLISRADSKSKTNMAAGLLAGVLLAWALGRVWR